MTISVTPWKTFRQGAGIALLFLLPVLGSCSGEDDVVTPPDPDVPEVPDRPAPDAELTPMIIPDEGRTDYIPAHDILIGSLCGFEGDTRTGNAYRGEGKPTTYYNIPLFESVPEGSDEGWWDNLVEEIAYSGVDYIMANLRGIQPTAPAKYVDQGDPNRLFYLVDAMQRRGLQDAFKIAFFDDCPASWEAARNEDLGRGYAQWNADNPGATTPYPLRNIEVGSQAFQDSILRYVWDYNLRIAFRNTPEEYMLKIDGRPLIFFWSCWFVGDEGSCNGKLVYLLDQIRARCMDEFGLDPFLVVDQDWTKRDHELTEATESLSGLNDWFNMQVPYTVRTFRGTTIGIGVPGFLVNDLTGDKMFLDADHGNLLNEALNHCVTNNSDIILLEGFTDVLENAAYWRSVDQTYYDFPNQRLNILRKWSSDPYPAEFRVEAEACDSYYDRSPGNSGGQYRKGDLDVKECTDTYRGWQVTSAQLKEWLRWEELPFSSGRSTIKLRYMSRSDASVRVDVGGVEGQEVSLPSTGGVWTDIDVALVDCPANGWHEVVLNIVSGIIDLNYFTIVRNG